MITIVQLLENMDENIDLPFVAGLHPSFEAGNRLMVASSLNKNTSELFPKKSLGFIYPTTSDIIYLFFSFSTSSNHMS